MPYNILIVDDSTVMRKIIRKSLRQTEFPINRELEAGDGYEALQILANHSVDFIFSDINMPKMDGLTFIKEVRKKPDLDNVKVIMITTEAGTDIVNEAISFGADEYIIKPFTPDQIMNKIQSAINA